MLSGFPTTDAVRIAWHKVLTLPGEPAQQECAESFPRIRQSYCWQLSREYGSLQCQTGLELELKACLAGMSLAVQTVFIFICYVRIYVLCIYLWKIKMVVYVLPVKFQDGWLVVLIIATRYQYC